jgi:hypothetical protein
MYDVYLYFKPAKCDYILQFTEYFCCFSVLPLVSDEPTAGGYKEMSSILVSWLTNSGFGCEPKVGVRGGVAGSQPMSKAVHRSPNKLLRFNSIFNL